MIRARFSTNGDDYRPVEWPIKHPYWCSGYQCGGEERAIIVAYADDEAEIRRLWPDAGGFDFVQTVDKYTFTDRFPKPEWMEGHGNDQPDMPEFVRKLLGEEPKPKTTGDELRDAMRQSAGEYPHGRLNQDDEGEIPMQIGHHSGKVIVRFPKPVTWVGLTGDGAMELAQCLIDHARAVGVSKPIAITIGGREAKGE
jgi:hypothetical protein